MKESFKNKILFVLIFVSCLLLSAVIVLAILYGTIDKKQEICTTKACISAANTILDNMDLSVDPCENFNQFTCGGFIQNQRLPDEEAKYDIIDILRNKLQNSVADLLAEPFNEKNDLNATKNAKILYRSCMNESSIESNSEVYLKNFLKDEFKGWPILGEWNNQFDPIDILIVSRKIGVRQIVDLHIAPNPKDPTRSILKIRQPNWFFAKEFYMEEKKKVIEAYETFMFNFVKYMGSTFSDTEISDQINEVLEIEKGFAQLALNGTEKRKRAFKTMSIQELIDSTPYFKWKEFIIDGIYANISNVKISLNESLIVDNWDYVVNATKLYENFTIKKEGVKVIKYLKKWILLLEHYKITFILKVYRGTNSMPSRSLTCAQFVLSIMEYAAGRLYVEKFFNKKSKEAATEMINYISEEFKKILKTNDWMDDISKQKAIDKLENIDTKIGYPEFIFDKNELNNRHKDFEFIEEDYFKNVIKINKIVTLNDFGTLRKEINRTDWSNGPAIVNAFYSTSANKISFPAAILQSPFYDAEQPNYLNYGAIGSVIGHEITHGFDDKGRLYDKNGIFYSDETTGLWTKDTIQKYKERIKCMIKQYDNYTVKQIKLNLNGYQTLGENIGDNGGVKSAFYAYQTWVEKNKAEPLLPGLNFNQNQLFFISYAQIWCGKFRDQTLQQFVLTKQHSVHEFRIIGPLSNFHEFSKAFKCNKYASNNSISEKCVVW